MSSSNTAVPFNNRILIVDDNPAIHDDFRKVLGGVLTDVRRELEDEEEAIFGKPQRPSNDTDFELTSAYQGQEGLEAVRSAARAGRPFAMAFVDIRMPPGWDGIETITAIWKEFPELQIVICTAYSDYSWDDMAKAFGPSDSVLVLKKPFDTVEVLQMAHALTKKWQLAQLAHKQVEELGRLVNQRAEELRTATEWLKRESAARTAAEAALRQSEERFSRLFEASPAAMAIMHPGRKVFTDANRSFLALTGRTREELLHDTQAANAIWIEPSAVALIHGMSGDAAPLRDTFIGIRDTNGGDHDGMLSTEIIEIGGEQHLLLIVQDITGRTSAEQVDRTEKLEAVGHLVA